jgi:hypothetical protein
MFEFFGKSDYIESEDLEGLDLAWFALDKMGQIAHFKTAGRGPVPKNLLKKDIDRLLQFFYEEAEKISDVLESQDWFRHARIKPRDKEKKVRYLSSFLKMAQRGLYSYDGPYFWDAPCLYFRIVIPKRPLLVNDLPDEIKNIMKKIVIKDIDFANLIELLPDQIGDYIM